MTPEQIERTIEFIIEQQARFTTDIEQLKGVQERQAANLDRLTADVQTLAQSVTAMQEEMEVNREETREAINNLIIANERTRELTETVARLAVATSQRVTALETKQDEPS
jgi:hypothetical protein